MEFNANLIIIIISALVILSYFFNLLSRALNIPSVLLLLVTGIGIRYLAAEYGWPEQDVARPVKILGAIGLIMIVLEAALDLKLSRSRVPLIRNALFAALFISLISAFAIAALVAGWMGERFENSLIFAIPLSIVSSAIAIPSAEHLPELKREFVVYESSLSDIIGILLFNYMVMEGVLNLYSSGMFVGKLLLAIVISAVASLLLTFLLARMQVSIKFFLLFAVLLLLFASGEMVHLPSLLIILVFGMLINNHGLVFRGPLKRWVDKGTVEELLVLLKSITAETSFLIRTFFFVLFGYSMNLALLREGKVLLVGSLIIGVLLLVRFLYLRLVLKTNLFPELFIMPRGLVTILLFYSIPPARQLGSLNEGILFFVVLATGLLMMIGLLFYRKDKALYREAEEAI